MTGRGDTVNSSHLRNLKHPRRRMETTLKSMSIVIGNLLGDIGVRNFSIPWNVRRTVGKERRVCHRMHLRR
ncbi:UNVERIFIED_CONTAM: hypothetical protein FKN15_072714 [Acipenser sinensis]